MCLAAIKMQNAKNKKKKLYRLRKYLNVICIDFINKRKIFLQSRCAIYNISIACGFCGILYKTKNPILLYIYQIYLVFIIKPMHTH